MVRLEFRRLLGQSQFSRILDIGLHVLGIALIAIAVVDACIGAFIQAACGVIAGLVIGIAPAIIRPAIFRDDYDIPPAPKGAALIHADGTRTALELVYVGQDDDGLAMFRATMPVNFIEGDELVMDELPPMTSVVGHWVAQ